MPPVRSATTRPATTRRIRLIATAEPLGYDPAFLGPLLPLTIPGTDAAALADLPYTHFTVILNRRRRLAAFTACNIDGAELVDVPRGDDWHLDDRITAEEQAGPEVYARNDLDRGHLVRRRDPVWGPDAARANFDTFSYANAAPQVNVFNQSKELWLGLEDYILDNAQATARRLSVITGPVFAASDPEHRGVRVPRRFFKVAAWAVDGTSDAATLACTAYLLDQGDLLDALDLRTAVAPELGAFRTFQLAVDEVAQLTGLDFGPLPAADRYVSRPGVLPAEWTPLARYADIRL